MNGWCPTGTVLPVTADDHLPGPVAVLVNPTAGRGRHRALLPRLLDGLAAAGRPVRLLPASSPAEAEAACRAAVAEGAGALVAVGGDGTVHRALQAVAGTDVPFGPIPAGTGNDFALDTGFPADPLAAAAVIAEAVRDGRSQPVDLARMVGVDGAERWYGAVLAAGFDAIVNERANRMRWPRGPRRYDLAIVVELARLRPAATRCASTGCRMTWTRCSWRWATAPPTAVGCGSAPTRTRPTGYSTWWWRVGSTGGPWSG